jgi:hypothetical protein
MDSQVDEESQVQPWTDRQWDQEFYAALGEERIASLDQSPTSSFYQQFGARLAVLNATVSTQAASLEEESQVQQFGAPPVPISALTPETFGAQLATSKDKGKTWQGDDRVAGEYQGPIPRTPTAKETCDKFFDNKDNWYKGRHKSDKSAGSSLCKCSDAEKHDMMKEKRQRLGAWTPGYCIWCGKVMPAAYQAKEAAYKHLKAVKNYIRHSVNLEAATQAQDEEEEELALNVFHMQSS